MVNKNLGVGVQSVIATTAKLAPGSLVQTHTQFSLPRHQLLLPRLQLRQGYLVSHERASHFTALGPASPTSVGNISL